MSTKENGDKKQKHKRDWHLPRMRFAHRILIYIIIMTVIFGNAEEAYI